MADSNVPISAGTGTNIDTFTQAGGDHRQAMVLGDPVSPQVAQVFPGGELRVQAEATQLFYDAYDTTLDTAARWNAAVTGNSAVAATTGSGVLSLATGTVASGYSVLTSQPTFRSSTPGWVRFAFNITLADGAAPTANSFRFWGAAAPQAVPTTANPISNGAGFEVATTGKMHAVIYNAASRTSVQDLSSSGSSLQPLDANPHNYQVFYRPTNIYWYIDGVLAATSSITQSALGVDALPLCYMAVGFSTPPSPSAVLSSNASSVSDTTAANATISDPVYGWRRANVGKQGGLSVRGSSITGQTLAVTAATPVDGAAVDVSEAGAVTWVVKNTVAGTAFTGSPVLVFQQSDDGTSWAPLPVAGPLGFPAATQVIVPNAASVEQMFDAAVEGVNWVRVRVTTAQATNGMTVVTQPGGLAFSPTVQVSPPPRVLLAGGTVAAGVTAGTTATDTIMSLAALYRAQSVLGTASSFAITAGKTLRIQSLTVMLINNAAAVGSAAFTLRAALAGTTTASSSVVFALGVSVPATANQVASQTVTFGDGIDLPSNAAGTNTFGISCRPVFASTAPNVAAWISGYEY